LKRVVFLTPDNEGGITLIVPGDTAINNKILVVNVDVSFFWWWFKSLGARAFYYFASACFGMVVFLVRFLPWSFCEEAKYIASTFPSLSIILLFKEIH